MIKAVTDSIRDHEGIEALLKRKGMDMDEIQKVLVNAGRKDLAQKYYQKISKFDDDDWGKVDTKKLQKQLSDWWRKDWKKIWSNIDKLKDLLNKYRSRTGLFNAHLSPENIDRHLSVVGGYLRLISNTLEDNIKYIEAAEKRQKL